MWLYIARYRYHGGTGPLNVEVAPDIDGLQETQQ